MKKIIAISVMFALIAGAVFAETSISGGVETRFSLAKQTGNDGDDPMMGGSIGNAAFQFSGSNADGTLGGTIKFKGPDLVVLDNRAGGPAGINKAFAWWKPVPQVRIFLGIDQDGMFDTSSIVGWGFHAGDNDYIFNHMWDFWRTVFPGNWDGFGLAFSFYPAPGLDINLALPTGQIGWRQDNLDAIGKNQLISGEGGMLPERLRLQGGYSLDFGRIQFAYNGGAAVADKGFALYSHPFVLDSDNNGQFGASFLFTALEGIQILAGGSVVLNSDSDAIIGGGLGVVWNGDGFGVKVRGGLVMQGDLDPFITANILPFFAVGEKGQVLVDIGITSCGDSMGWSLIPAYRLPIDGGAFKIGLQIYNNVNSGGNVQITGAEYVKWNIPLSLAFNF